MQFAIQSCNQKDSGECVVGGISLDCYLSVHNPMGKDQSCPESLFKCFKSRVALIGEMPRGTLGGKTYKWNCDFGISMNEALVEVGEVEERLNILDFPWYGPILDNLGFVWGHGEGFR